MGTTTDSKESTTIDYGTKLDDRLKELGYTPLLWPSNGGECPSPARWSNKNKQCCCGPNCCWDQCRRPSGLQGVLNSHWVLITNNSLGGYYQAIQSTGIYLMFLISFCFFIPEYLLFSFLEST